jgi:hypothetical protein
MNHERITPQGSQIMNATHEQTRLTDDTPSLCCEPPGISSHPPNPNPQYPAVRLSHFFFSGLLLAFFCAAALSISAYFLIFENVDFVSQSDHGVLQHVPNANMGFPSQRP